MCSNPEGHCWHWDKKPVPPDELLGMLEDDEDYCCFCPERRRHEREKHGEYLSKPSAWQDGVEWDYDVA